MKTPKRELTVFTIILITSLAGACGSISATPTDLATTTSSPPPPILSITPSPTPSAIPLPTNSYTPSPEPDIAPNCKIANEEGQLHLLSDQEFRDLRTDEGILDQALAAHYPEWATYTQMVSWSTQPIKLGEIVKEASFNIELNLQINPTVTLVTLGESLDWQLPATADLFSESREVSMELSRLSFAWENPFDDSLRRQYPEVANSGTYALYAFFDYNLDRLQRWCNTYQQLFGNSP
ncbi:hypothetical protein FBQ81_17025 [Chloroflexi bacterium CFX6]|nr:hypothetical protein [Chloroflexi bacterium CFX6]